jgi:hypothetical protein
MSLQRPHGFNKRNIQLLSFFLSGYIGSSTLAIHVDKGQEHQFFLCQSRLKPNLPLRLLGTHFCNGPWKPI